MGISEALMELENKDAVRIFGFPDFLKLRSCMTLFAAVSKENSVFQSVLDAYYHGEKDERTVELLKVVDSRQQRVACQTYSVRLQ